MSTESPQSVVLKRATAAIVIPAYNAEVFLSRAVNSVLAQSYKDWTLCIVDDGSKDGTADIGRRFAKLDSRIIFVEQENSGVSAARNLGAQSTDSEFILDLDCDDYLEPDALEVLLGFIRENPEAVAAHGMARYIDEIAGTVTADVTESFGYDRLKVTNSGVAHVPPVDPTTFESMVIWPCISTPGQVLIRREALDKAGHFPDSRVLSEDWDLWLRLCLLGPIIRLPQFTVNKCHHGANISSNGKIMSSGEPTIRRRLAQTFSLTAEQRRIARMGHRYSCVVKLSWAKEALHTSGAIDAAKELRRALISYARYLSTPYSFI